MTNFLHNSGSTKDPVSDAIGFLFLTLYYSKMAEMEEAEIDGYNRYACFQSSYKKMLPISLILVTSG